MGDTMTMRSCLGFVAFMLRQATGMCPLVWTLRARFVSNVVCAFSNPESPVPFNHGTRWLCRDLGYIALRVVFLVKPLLQVTNVGT